MAQARTLSSTELQQVLNHVQTRKYAARNQAMLLLTHWAGLRVGEVACLRWSDVIKSDGAIKDEIRLLPDMTKGRHARTVFVNEKLQQVLQQYADQAECIDRSYPFFASQKSVKSGFSANSLAQTFALLYKSAGIEGASSHSGRRTFLTNLSAKSVPLKVLMELANHRQAQTTMRYISVTADMKRAAVELL